MGIIGETEFQRGCEADNKISKNGEIEPLLEVARGNKLHLAIPPGGGVPLHMM